MQDTVIELRQYTLHAGRRDELIELFEREFIETQEAAGIRVIGQFRDQGDPNRFVWLRGFTDMAARGPALAAFYDGPAWARHRSAANATMVDSDNVLLLRPAHAAAGFLLPPRPLPQPGLVLAAICPFNAKVPASFIDFFEQIVKPSLARAGALLLGSYVTETSANNFPRLPVREGESVFVWFAAVRDAAAAEHRAATQGVRPWLAAEPQVLRLAPTARSRLQPSWR